MTELHKKEITPLHKIKALHDLIERRIENLEEYESSLTTKREIRRVIGDLQMLCESVVHNISHHDSVIKNRFTLDSDENVVYFLEKQRDPLLDNTDHSNCLLEEYKRALFKVLYWPNTNYFSIAIGNGLFPEYNAMLIEEEDQPKSDDKKDEVREI